MTSKTASPELLLVLKLNGELDRLDEAQRSAEDAISSLRERRATLEARVTDLTGRRPQADTAEQDDVLVEALCADPATCMPADALAQAAESRAAIEKAAGAWKAELHIAQRAIERTDREISQAEEAWRQRASERDAVWGQFVLAAHDYLLAEFRSRFEQLYFDVLAPMKGLRQLKDREGVPFIGLHVERIDEDSPLKVVKWADKAKVYLRDQLYPLQARTVHGLRDLDCTPDVDRFRTTLARAK